eukprot:763277-Hanusia_phi.AAC.1
MIEKREKIILHQQLSSLQALFRTSADRRNADGVFVDLGILQADQRFVPATKFSLQEEQEEKLLTLRRGDNGGLGIRFAVSESGKVVITQVMAEGSAASQGGVKVGDEIISVESHRLENDLQGKTAEEKERAVQEIANLIKGSPGSNVNLRLRTFQSRAIDSFEWDSSDFAITPSKDKSASRNLAQNTRRSLSPVLLQNSNIKASNVFTPRSSLQEGQNPHDSALHFWELAGSTGNAAINKSSPTEKGSMQIDYVARFLF